MKAKIGAIFLVSVMALTAVGAAYAHWQDVLVIEGDITMDDMDVYFDCWSSNDPWGSGSTQIQSLDPKGCGFWDDGTWFWDNDPYTPDRRTKDIASIDIDKDPEFNDKYHLKITVEDAYPCYYGNVEWCIYNSGSVPALLQHDGMLLTHVSIDEDPEDGTDPVVIALNPPVSLNPTSSYSVAYSKPAGGSWTAIVVADVPAANLKDYDYTLTPSGFDLDVNTQLDPDYWTDGDKLIHLGPDETYLGIIEQDLCIHFENNCREDYGYDFTISMTWYNWPHYVENQFIDV